VLYPYNADFDLYVWGWNGNGWDYLGGSYNWGTEKEELTISKSTLESYDYWILVLAYCYSGTGSYAIAAGEG